jgi:hypothetical protein
MEVNQSATELLLKGTVAEGLPDWDHGRPQPVKFIDFENPANNDFLVINQFKVELTSGRGHVIPDAVLFVNGIPLVVAEFKSPGIQNPLQEAIKMRKKLRTSWRRWDQSRRSAQARRSSSARWSSGRQRCAARAPRCKASRSSWPACCARLTCSTSSTASRSFGRWTAKPIR